ncbi:MAG: ATP synthase F1 subunit gamma [Muribaculaceae bacterium]|nr:ATP synthase F1 subunit gamma [Muribaculaceae bacterium]
MATLRELKGRIGSVASSEKITGAMKMISSAKMHKAELALKQLRPYRDQVETIIANLLTSDAAFSSPLMNVRPVGKSALVVWGSDDGLCGAYNVNIFKRLLQHVAEFRQKHGQEASLVILPVGGKMAKAVAKLRMPGVSVEVPGGVDSKSSDTAVRDFTWQLRDRFLSGEFDSVELLYMSFKSVSRQCPETAALLPVTDDTFASSGAKATGRPYIFEPDAATIFTRILPMYLLAVVQDVFTENRASEQAARVMAMQSANDNAKKLHDQLQLEFNKLRQQAITTELLDILGGQVK